MLALSGPGTDTGMSSPITPTISTTAPTSKINRRKFMCRFYAHSVRVKLIETIVETGPRWASASPNMLFLFDVVAVARKELDALVGHGLVVLLAVLAAVFLAIGIVVRQRATMDVPQEHGVSSVMFLTLLRRPLWWAGTAAAVAGLRLPGAGAREGLAAVGAADPGFRPAVRAAVERTAGPPARHPR